MTRLGELLATKGNQVFTIEPQATVLAAAELMNQHRIGCLLVCEGTRIHGILSERDILQRVVAARRDPSKTTVAEVMTVHVIFASPDMPIEQATNHDGKTHSPSAGRWRRWAAVRHDLDRRPQRLGSPQQRRHHPLAAGVYLRGTGRRSMTNTPAMTRSCRYFR